MKTSEGCSVEGGERKEPGPAQILDSEEKSLVVLALGAWMGCCAQFSPSIRETIKRTQAISDKLGLGLTLCPKT